MGKLKMVVLTNHMLTGVCVSVCDTGLSRECKHMLCNAV